MNIVAIVLIVLSVISFGGAVACLLTTTSREELTQNIMESVVYMAGAIYLAVLAFILKTW